MTHIVTREEEIAHIKALRKNMPLQLFALAYGPYAWLDMYSDDELLELEQMYFEAHLEDEPVYF